MAPPKRKRPDDEDEAVHAGKTRRVTRQTSIAPPPLPIPPKNVPQRRVLRGNTGPEGKANDAADTKTRQGTVRTRTQRASGTSTSRAKAENKDTDSEDDRQQDQEHEPDGDEGEDEEARDGGPEPSPRMKRRLARRGVDKKEELKPEPEPEPKPAPNGSQGGRTGRLARYGRAAVAAAARRTTAASRGTRQPAKDTEIADSDADEAVEDDASDANDASEGEEDTEDELAGPATIIPPRTRGGAPPLAPPPVAQRTRRLSTAQPAVTPVSPPKVPVTRAAAQAVPEIIKPPPPAKASSSSTTASKKETNTKPPAPPSPSTAAASLSRPKKVTEIKPPVAPALRHQKTTPIQPPLLPVSPTRTTPAQALPPPWPEVQPQPQKPKSVQQLREEAAPSPRQQQAARTPRQTIVTTAASAATAAPCSASTPTSATSLNATSTAPPASPSQPDRNIDKVVLGEICFKAWYPSYYGKEVLGDTAGNTHHGRGGAHQAKGAGKENHHHAPSHHYQQHAYGHGHGGKDKDAQPMLDRLYVCPFCFKYSKEIVPWHGHVQVCESQFQIPGEKVYVHPKGVRTIRVPVSSSASASASASASSASKGSKRNRVSSEADIHYVEQVVKDEGEWSIWEVDGEKDVLFCQNLSLFAKLFLDNKSVFFDVTGFYYFLLVYTPPPSLPSSLRAAATATASSMGGANANGQASILGAAPRPRVVGFFSKEKMSWDNNNLACILVFPPWQRKGLGALLMGISYEISRREAVLGGPEKPISDLGKKGYKRFWGAEIARWLLSIDIATATSSLPLPEPSSSAVLPSLAPHTTAILPPILPPPYSSSNTQAAITGTDAEEESLIIDIADCSRATWIVREDCLYVLREMGIAEDAGKGLPKKYCDNVLAQTDDHPSSAADDGASGPTGATGTALSSSFTGAGVGAPGAAPMPASSLSAQISSASSSGAGGAQAANGAASGSASTGTGAAAGPAAAGIDPPREVQHVRISKAAVWQWVKDNRINLEKACDPAGFIKIYTNKEEAQQAAEET
ncbi:SAS complex subunit [Sporothrix curviconia]|uniref:SAS complex subunit n=1 Tax=Sporothrix curviconia TaxID=1260050 RepID=A0ABP0AMD7_9PEZI